MLNDLIERVRRNHALEHATLHVLEEQTPKLRAGGRATIDGFYLFGELNSADIAAAAEEAIKRMNDGQPEMAVHPRCGTNLVTAGVLGGALALLGIVASGKRAPWYAQLPSAITGAMLGAFLAHPLGPWMQANVTTSADMRGAHVRGVERKRMGPMPTHFVATDYEIEK